MNGAALELVDLCIDFDVRNAETFRAVDHLSLRLEAGQRFGLVGESGSGKSTTIMAIMGLLPTNATSSGSLLLGSRAFMVGDLNRTAESFRWSEVAMVFQGAMNAFNPVLTIGDQITETIRAHSDASKRAARTRTKELLGLVDLPAHSMDQFPHQLSGGMKQRAMIALSLCCEPRVLLADEPTTALDVLVQAQVLQLLDRLCAELELSLLMVTHDLGVVAELCSDAAIMLDGRIVDCGSLDYLYHESEHEYTRLLFGASDVRRDPEGAVDVDGSRLAATGRRSLIESE